MRLRFLPLSASASLQALDSPNPPREVTCRMKAAGYMAVTLLSGVVLLSTARAADPDPYDAALFSLVVPNALVTRAGPGEWWLAPTGGGRAWKAQRNGTGYVFTAPDNRRGIAQPDGRNGWKLTRPDSSVPEAAQRSGTGGLDIHRPDGSGRRSSRDGHQVSDRAATSGWGNAYDLDRGQHVPGKK